MLQEGQPFSFPEGHELAWKLRHWGATRLNACSFLHPPPLLFESLPRASTACPLPLCAVACFDYASLSPRHSLSFFPPYLFFFRPTMLRSSFLPFSIYIPLACTAADCIIQRRSIYEFDLRFVLPAVTAPTQ